MPLRPGAVRPSHASEEQEEHSVKHKEHTVSDTESRTLVHPVVLENWGGRGGLHTRQRSALLLGARKTHEVERHGFNPETQCMHKETTNAGRVHFSVEQMREDADVILTDAMPTSRIVSEEEPEGGWHKEQ